MMIKKAKKNMVGLEKVNKKDSSFRKDLETYLIFGLVVLFVGIFIGTTASAISIYKDKEPDNIDTIKMIESTTPSTEDDKVSTEDLNLEDLEQVQGAVQEPNDDYLVIYSK